MIQCLLFSSILLALQAQTQTFHKHTLSESASKGQNSSLEAKASQFLLKAHPQLSEYAVISINSTINRGDQLYTDNLRDFLFQLESPTNHITAMVTISGEGKEQFASVSPLVIAEPSRVQPNLLGDYWISKNVPSSPPNSINHQQSSSDLLREKMESEKGGNIPGSFIQYTNLNDSLVQFSLDYVAGLHPNIVNYRVDKVLYQIVAGINIEVSYLGLDGISGITAVVSFDLQVNPSLTAFLVSCISIDNFCNPTAIRNIYNAIEGVILSHPELFSYRIKSLVVKDPVSVGSFTVMVTFENIISQLQSLLQLKIDGNQLTVLSFFTYSISQ